MKLLKNYLAALLTAVVLPISAQDRVNLQTTYPENFNIELSEYNALLGAAPGEQFRSTKNMYLSGAEVLKNIKNGDMQYVRLQLPALKHAFLSIQVNGIYSTQVFITHETDSLFYRGRFSEDALTLSRCKKEDIVVE